MYVCMYVRTRQNKPAFDELNHDSIPQGMGMPGGSHWGGINSS